MDQNPATVNQETSAPVVHEVDSNYAKHDIKIPREKKSRVGLIVGIIVGILLLLGAIFALWFCVWYSNPNQVAYDAVNQLIKADNIGLEGSFAIFPNDEDSAIKEIMISFDQATSGLPSSTSAQIFFIFDAEKVQGEPRVLIDVKNVILRDGVIYLQIAGLMDSINTLEIDEDTRSTLEIYFNTLELIDNEWWQISIPDLLQTMELPSEQSNALSEAYQCAMQAFGSDMSSEVAEIYKQHQFVQLTPSKTYGPSDNHYELASGHKAYELTIDKAKMASFVNRLPETAVAEEFFGCFNQVMNKYGGDGSLSVSDFDEITADDISWPDSDELRIFLEISQFDHKLRSFSIYSSTDGEVASSDGTVLVKYDTVTVTPPESYRPITELFDELSELFSQFFVMPADYYEEV